MFYNHENFYPQKGKHLLNIGLIPDGARRWAKNKDISTRESYKISIGKIYIILSHLLEKKNIGSIVIYFSSIQNFKRTSDEINMFCEIQNDFFRKEALVLKRKYNVGIKIVGDIEFVPFYLYETLLSLMNIEKQEKNLYFCIAYDPITELYNAFNKSKDISEFPMNLEIPLPLDFVIRTGGANLLSNFLPIQSGYARIYSTEKLFNDLSLDDIDEVIKIFSETQLKYGE